MEGERLGSLLKCYDMALSELYAWDDKGVSDLIIRLEVWRTAAQLELMFLEPARATPVGTQEPAVT
jgi:hypothetical protein